MVEIFTQNVTEALDEITPMKTFKIKSHHKFGLSEVAKEIMRQRDKSRGKIKNASPTEKQIFLMKYRKLGNKANYRMART